jgi:hypothetical protein
MPVTYAFAVCSPRERYPAKFQHGLEIREAERADGRRPQEWHRVCTSPGERDSSVTKLKRERIGHV